MRAVFSSVPGSLMTMAFSWQGGLVLDERPGISYPDGFQAPDGTITISYDRNRSTDGEILMARFTEEDVLAKEFRGPMSKAKMLISKPMGLERSRGFTFLTDGKTFDGWEHKGNWVIDEEGAFYRKEKGGSLTYTAATVPDNFELRFEWKVSKGCNSGVYYRPGQVEYQVLDNVHSPYGENARQAAGSLFFCMAPREDATRPFGEWNSGRIICDSAVIEHWVNEKRVLSFDYSDPKWKEYVDLLGIRGGDLGGRGGKLWLQDHGQDVWYRNLRWRELGKDEVITAHPTFEPMPVTGEALKKEQERVRKMRAANEAARKKEPDRKHEERISPGKEHQSGQASETDVCIYGGTSGGVIAAVQASRMGKGRHPRGTGKSPRRDDFRWPQRSGHRRSPERRGNRARIFHPVGRIIREEPELGRNNQCRGRSPHWRSLLH